MNRQTADKVTLFLTGLQSRYSGSRDFFLNMSAHFTSGTKTYSLNAHAKSSGEDVLCFNFMGNGYELSFGDLIAFIADKIPQFDEMPLVYSERGKNIEIRADGRNVVTGTTDAALTENGPAGGVSVMSDREYFIKPDRAADLLEAIGILGRNGKVRNDKIRKYNQIDHFIELADPLLRRLCRIGDKKSDRPISIIDCGCGKSYLSFALNFYIKEILGRNCYFTGLDINPNVIEESRRTAEKLRYKNMKFIETDIAAYEPDGKYDMLLTLHACDTATDKALRFAIDNNIRSVICVPCCHKELGAQYSIDGFEDILKYGILKARIADSLTDGLRAMYLEAQGYEVSMLEYISPIDTPKNLMIKAIRTGGKREDMLNRYRNTLKALGAHLTIGE